MSKNEKNKKTENNGKANTTYDTEHKEQLPEIPKPVINPPKEATDPAEIIKRA